MGPFTALAHLCFITLRFILAQTSQHCKMPLIAALCDAKKHMRIFVYLLFFSLLSVGLLLVLKMLNPDEDYWTSTLKITNQTGQPIKNIAIFLNEDVCYIDQIKNNSLDQCTFQIVVESSYAFSAQLDSGQDIRKENFGYLIPGFNVEDEIIIDKSLTITLDRTVKN